MDYVKGDKMLIVKTCDVYLNIREKTSTDSKVIGQIKDYNAYEAEPVKGKKKSDWYELKDGGFVMAKFVAEAELDEFEFAPEELPEEAKEPTKDGADL